MKKTGFFLLALLLIAASLSCSRQDTLIKNKQSDYRIVIPAKACKSDLKAASYLQRYLEQAGGVRLPILRDRDPAVGKEISIGKTNRLDETLLERCKQMKNDGFVIIRQDDRLYLLGESEKSVIYAVSSFLERFAGVQVLSAEVVHVPAFKTLRVPANLDWTCVPPFSFRSTHYRDTWNPFYADWHKLHHLPNGGHPDWGWWVHTFNNLVPPDQYYQEHPEYYAEINGNRVPTQLCLTNPDVFKITVENLRKAVEERPELTHWSVSQNDNVSYCQCASCRELDEKHGGQMGSLLTFVNAVADSFPDKVISTLAYQYSRKPPVGLVPRENVNIMLCTIELSRSESIATSDDAASFRDDLEGWGRLTDDILIWDYVIQFENLVSPFPNLHVLQPNLQYFLEQNAFKHFQQGNREVGGEFAELRSFLISKLLWDPYSDVDSLKQIFLEAYYGSASPYIRRYIDQQTAALVESGSRLDIFGHPFQAMETWLTPELMKDYIHLFDRAEEAVTDQPDLLQRVKIARMPLQYAQIEIATRLGTAPGGMYQKNTSGRWEVRDDLKEMAADLIVMANMQGVTRFKEWHTTPDEYLSALQQSWSVDMQPHLGLDREVELEEAASPKYAAGHPGLLTDGLRGPALTYTYNWLGFEGTECDARLDLGSPKEISSMTSHWLQDVRSWIFVPESVEYFISDDGLTWSSAGTVTPHADQQAEGVRVMACELKLDTPVSARYVRMKTESLLVCPDWHHGSGGPAWIFTDEWIIK